MTLTKASLRVKEGKIYKYFADLISWQYSFIILLVIVFDLSPKVRNFSYGFVSFLDWSQHKRSGFGIRNINNPLLQRKK